MKRLLLTMVIFAIGFYGGFNIFKFNPLYRDKLGLKNGKEIPAFYYLYYNDRQYNKKYYFQTAFKSYGRPVDAKEDRKYLIYTLLFVDKEDFDGIQHVFFPMNFKWIWQSFIDKIMGRKTVYKSDINSQNEYGDFIVWELPKEVK